jgi:hypothetical protein
VSHAPTRTDLACRNCGAHAPLKFCPECGQETTLHPPTLREFLHEFVGHYVALEGELWRTLALLLRRPGRLTREYLDGRRRRYVLPLRLYLTASFLFFLVLKLTASGAFHGVDVTVDGRHTTLAQIQAEAEAEAASEAAAAGASAASGSGSHTRFVVMRPADCGRPGKPACGRVETLLNDAAKHFEEHPQEAMEHMRAHLMGWAPYAIFFLLPAFAGIMQLAYRDRRMTYGEHFVFSLHLHAFWFLAAMVLGLLPDSLSDVLTLAVPVYGVWAMREAYGGRWLPTALRAMLVTLLYGIVLTIALLVLFYALLATS